jgi:YtoQ family protein
LTGSSSLPIEFTSPVTDHDASDNCGVKILGDEDKPSWKDHKGASINSIRTKTLLDDADLVIVRFGEKYRQWNAAFDAGYAAASGIPIITLHDEEHNHALKEINAAACASARTTQQVVDILRYVTTVR